jgi:hypothetical protein
MATTGRHIVFVVNRGQSERFEARFAPLRSSARDIPAILAREDRSVPGDQFPEATAERQILAVTPLYHAAVAALAEPETSLGALALMRPLIETWMHMYFIMGEDDMADAACRAIRLEAGWAADTLGLVRASGEELASEIDKAQRRLDEIESLRNRRRCKGGRRGYGDADQTARTMAAKLDIDWLMGAWRSSSQMVHAAGWDWSIEAQGDGTVAAIHPTPSHRAARLNHLVVLYYNVAQTYLVITGIDLDSDVARAIHKASFDILENRWLARMIDGDFD